MFVLHILRNGTVSIFTCFRTSVRPFSLLFSKTAYIPEIKIPYKTMDQFNQSLQTLKLGLGLITLTRQILLKPGQMKLIDFSSDFQVNDIVLLLIETLHCSASEAENLLNHYTDFLHLHWSRISDRVKILEKRHITHATIKENFWLLVHDKEQILPRIKLLQEWQFRDINNGINILKLPFLQLQKFTLRTKSELNINNGMNRITYFAVSVGCEEKVACEYFMKYIFMMTLKMETMKEILALIKDQEIVTEDLLQDLWLFRYSPNFIVKRIELLESMSAKEKCKVIKPWMLRCPEQTVNRYFERREDNIAALGSRSNIRDLLSSELGMSLTQVDEMIMKHPPLATMSYSKAKDMIDYLRAEGFESRMIYNVPRVLCHKQATLAARLAELRKISPHLINLQNLCRNKKDYVAFLNKMS